MKQYRIPNTELDISRMAYGTWHIGGSWDATPLSADLKNRANRLVQTAVELGINHIDLADIYTKGKSDEAIGYALSQNPGFAISCDNYRRECLRRRDQGKFLC